MYTDGSCIDPNTPKARAGIGIYCEEDNGKNRALRLPGKVQTNQIAELMEILIVLKETPKGDKLEILSDSQYALKGIIEGIREWEDKGWLGVENSDLFKEITYELDTRGAVTKLTWTKAHARIEGNEKGDEKAKREQRKRRKKWKDRKCQRNTNWKGQGCQQ